MSQRNWTIGSWPWLPTSAGAPLLRVIIDNDFAGDPDNLFQLAHHLLSPSVEIRTIISSHLRPGDALHPELGSAAAGVRVVERLAEVMRLDLDGRLCAGSELGLAQDAGGRPSVLLDLGGRSVSSTTVQARPSSAARAIVAEAMREGPGLAPLVVACGGGLTDLASAWLMEPAIASRLTVIWIGGPEHRGLGHRSPLVRDPEYNLATDPLAAQLVLNDSDLPLWLVPRNVYRQCLVSHAELRNRVAACGELGAFLASAVERRFRSARASGRGHGETYTLGDSPLVLLTALQSFYGPEPSSSDYEERPCPHLDAEGCFDGREGGRPIRVCSRLDTRLLFEDMFAVFEEFARWMAGDGYEGVIPRAWT